MPTIKLGTENKNTILLIISKVYTYLKVTLAKNHRILLKEILKDENREI